MRNPCPDTARLPNGRVEWNFCGDVSLARIMDEATHAVRRCGHTVYVYQCQVTGWYSWTWRPWVVEQLGIKLLLTLRRRKDV